MVVVLVLAAVVAVAVGALGCIRLEETTKAGDGRESNDAGA